MRFFFIFCVFVFCNLHGLSQTINIHSISDQRQPGGFNSGYTLDGFYMNGDPRQKLLNSINFGPAGTYPKSINITDSYITSNSLTAVGLLSTDNIFFFGAFDTLNTSLNQFTSLEIDSLYSWSKRGGKVIFATSAPVSGYGPPSLVNSKWGFDITLAVPSAIAPTPVGNSTDLFNGPFGFVSIALQGAGAQGYFSSFPTNSVVLGTNNGFPTLVMDCNTLDLLVPDVDVYTQNNLMSNGNQIITDQDKFWANTIAFMDGLQPLPILSNNSGNLTLNASYAGYQWFHDGVPISTSPQYNATDCGDYYAEVTFNGGCKMNTDTISVTGGMPLYNEIACDSLVSPSGNYVWTTTGTYSDTLQDTTGCSIIATVNLFIINGNISTSNVTSCGSYTSPSGNYIWSSSGIYADTLQNMLGCDSVVTVNLTITGGSSSSIINVNTCDSYISPSGNYTWTSNGVYTDTLQNTLGCDSIITVNLNITGSSSFSVLNASDCDSLVSPSGNYVWTTTGTYTDTLQNSSGCDSIITVNLNINETSQVTLLNVNTCDDYTSPSGLYNWTSSGVYNDTLQNISGCDSVVTINLNILGISSASSVNVTACNSYVSPSGAYTWTTSGMYTDTLQSMQNCDSIVTVYLTVDTCNSSVLIPNIFTPNGDGVNELFMPLLGKNIVGISMKIYNRWGQLMHESNQLDQGWDGDTIDGKKAVEGSYYYLMQIEVYENGQSSTDNYKGTLMLIR